MQLLMEEHNTNVHNLGVCVPVQTTVLEIIDKQPELVVISSVNGHGYTQGLELIKEIKRSVKGKLPTIVIGGKLSIKQSDNQHITKDLLACGFDGVFVNHNSIPEFLFILHQIKRNFIRMVA